MLNHSLKVRWNISQSSDCSFCLKSESLLHVVAGCKTYLEEDPYTWRQNSALNFIASSLKDINCLISSPSTYLSKLLLSVPGAPMTIAIITTFLTLHNFATSLRRSSYISFFSSSLSITLRSNGHETSIILHSLFSSSYSTMSGRL